jgi:hypothetical protein
MMCHELCLSCALSVLDTQPCRCILTSWTVRFELKPIVWTVAAAIHRDKNTIKAKPVVSLKFGLSSTIELVPLNKD